MAFPNHYRRKRPVILTAYFTCGRDTAKTWLNVPLLERTRRTYAMNLPSGEKTQASGRGATSSEERGVMRVVIPEAASVTQTLLSITWAIVFPSLLQVKVEPMSHALPVN